MYQKELTWLAGLITILWYSAFHKMLSPRQSVHHSLELRTELQPRHTQARRARRDFELQCDHGLGHIVNLSGDLRSETEKVRSISGIPRWRHRKHPNCLYILSFTPLYEEKRCVRTGSGPSPKPAGSAVCIFGGLPVATIEGTKAPGGVRRLTSFPQANVSVGSPSAFR